MGAASFETITLELRHLRCFIVVGCRGRTRPIRSVRIHPPKYRCPAEARRTARLAGQHHHQPSPGAAVLPDDVLRPRDFTNEHDTQAKAEASAQDRTHRADVRVTAVAACWHGQSPIFARRITGARAVATIPIPGRPLRPDTCSATILLMGVNAYDASTSHGPAQTYRTRRITVDGLVAVYGHCRARRSDAQGAR